MKKTYRVLNEYRHLWSNESENEWDGIVDMDEIERLAAEWETSVGELLDQVEEVFDFDKTAFREFLDENLKAKDYSFDAFCRDLKSQYMETGRSEYELKAYETKSGHAEIFSY